MGHLLQLIALHERDRPAIRGDGKGLSAGGAGERCGIVPVSLLDPELACTVVAGPVIHQPSTVRAELDGPYGTCESGKARP